MLCLVRPRVSTSFWNKMILYLDVWAGTRRNWNFSNLMFFVPFSWTSNLDKQKELWVHPSLYAVNALTAICIMPCLNILIHIFNIKTTVLFSTPENYTVYPKTERVKRSILNQAPKLAHYIWLNSAGCKPACYPEHSDPQSSAQQKPCHRPKKCFSPQI